MKTFKVRAELEVDSPEAVAKELAALAIEEIGYQKRVDIGYLGEAKLLLKDIRLIETGRKKKQKPMGSA